MKINSNLYQKTIDLNGSHIFGGREPETEMICTSYSTNSEGCEETTITYKDDEGVYITHVTLVVCPD